MEEFIERPAYYSVTPASVRYAETLCMGAKMLYSEITVLCNHNGYCWASNEYFAKLYKVSIRTIRSWITSLVEQKFLVRELIKKENSNEVDKRILKITDPNICGEKNFLTSGKNLPEGREKNFLYNNTSINSISDIDVNQYRECENFSEEKVDSTKKSKSKKETKKSFIPPSLDDVKRYITEKNLSVDAKAFYDYFDVGGWVDSKGNKVKNWKQKLITWSSHSKPKKADPKSCFNSNLTYI